MQPGDLAFENGYRIPEDEGDGLAFVNRDGSKIASLDYHGNVQIKGKVMSDI